MQESELCCIQVVQQADPHADKRAATNTAAAADRAEVKEAGVQQILVGESAPERIQ